MQLGILLKRQYILTENQRRSQSTRLASIKRLSMIIHQDRGVLSEVQPIKYFSSIVKQGRRTVTRTQNLCWVSNLSALLAMCWLALVLMHTICKGQLIVTKEMKCTFAKKFYALANSFRPAPPCAYEIREKLTGTATATAPVIELLPLLTLRMHHHFIVTP